VSKDYPLEVITQTEAWTKVRDHAGALSWIEAQEARGAPHGAGDGEGRGRSACAGPMTVRR